MKTSNSYFVLTCSKEVSPSKWPVINKIYFVLQYFYCIVHFDCSLQEVLHIWYQSTFLGSLGGISGKKNYAMLPSAVSLTVVLLLAAILFTWIRD